MKLSFQNKSLLSIFALLILISCEKEPEHTCDDGLLSPGEEGVDCGGPCSPCPEPEPFAFASADINGIFTQYGTYNLEKSDDWIISFQNDTSFVQLNIGDGDSLGARDIKTAFSFGELHNVDYPILSSGTCLFTEIDHDAQRLSFFFEAKLIMDPTGPNYNPYDTLVLKNGDFEYIEWENI